MKCIFKQKKVDWGLAEQLAFGTLILDGNNVRLSGQDCQRGTFSHRHSVIKDEQNETHYTPLNQLSKTNGFEVLNSHLSEYCVMGFEYGYSLASPNDLTIWEAQFGDFSNGAQIMIDQYLSSSEKKWQRMSGLTLLLPHGYEGQGLSIRQQDLNVTYNCVLRIICMLQILHLQQISFMHFVVK